MPGVKQRSKVSGSDTTSHAKRVKMKKERQFNVHEIIYKHKAGRENKEEKFAEKV